MYKEETTWRQGLSHIVRQELAEGVPKGRVICMCDRDSIKGAVGRILGRQEPEAKIRLAFPLALPRL